MYAVTHIGFSVVRSNGRPGSAGGGPGIWIGDFPGRRRSGVGDRPGYASNFYRISVVSGIANSGGGEGVGRQAGWRSVGGAGRGREAGSPADPSPPGTGSPLRTGAYPFSPRSGKIF